MSKTNKVFVNNMNDANEKLAEAALNKQDIIVIIKGKLVIGYNAAKNLISAAADGVVKAWVGTSNWLKDVHGQNMVQAFKDLTGWLKGVFLAVLAWVDDKIVMYALKKASAQVPLKEGNVYDQDGNVVA